MDMKHEQEAHDDHKYEEEAPPFSAGGCCCFGLLSFQWNPNNNNNNEDKYLLNQRTGEERDTWLVKKLKKAKEVSEKLAGPKWKTFIRKMSGYLKNKRKQKNNHFQYDPESYALNFDAGFDKEEYCLLPDFSSRFAAAPVNERS